MLRLTVILATIAAGLVALGYLFYWNPESVTVRLSGTSEWQAPLPLVLLATFLIGAIVTFAISLVREGRHAFAGWRRQRRAQIARRQQVRKEQGLRLSWLGTYDKARTMLAKALRDRPDDLAAFLLFARTFVKEGDYQRAIDVLEEGLDTRGPDPKLLLLLAQARSGLGDTTAAIDSLERAQRVDPDSPAVLGALRDAYVAAARWRDAAAVQERLLLAVRDPHLHADAERRLVGMRYQGALGVPDPTMRASELRALLRAHPDFEPAAVSLGDALLEAGLTRQAERVWRRALARGSRAAIFDRLERLLRSGPRLRRLDVLTRRLVRRRPADGTARLFRARQLVRDGRLEEAATELTQVGPPWSSLAAYHALLAELHVRRAAWDDAITAFRHALAAGTPSAYRCDACGAEVDEWRGLCTACGGFGTLRSGFEVNAFAARDGRLASGPAPAERISPPSPR